MWWLCWRVQYPCHLVVLSSQLPMENWYQLGALIQMWTRNWVLQLLQFLKPSYKCQSHGFSSNSMTPRVPTLDGTDPPSEPGMFWISRNISDVYSKQSYSYGELVWEEILKTWHGILSCLSTCSVGIMICKRSWTLIQPGAVCYLGYWQSSNKNVETFTTWGCILV